MTLKKSSEPANEPIKTLLLVRVNILSKLYSDPKIYRPTEIVDGKKVVTVKKLWHVYYYYRNPFTGKMDKFTERKGINRIKTKTGREQAARNLQRALRRYLQDGFNPFEVVKVDADVEKESYTAVDALKLAFEHRKNTWKETTKDVNKSYLDSFIKWLTDKKINDKSITEITKKHISFYLSDLLKTKTDSNTTRNNHRRFLSSMFTELVEKDIIADNFIKKIPLLKSTPKKNKPFNTSQLEDILKYVRENEPYLYQYLKVMWYTFLRPIEILRIEINNINLQDNVIDINTKTKGREYVRIVKPLQVYLGELKLQQYEAKMFLFGKDQKPGYWVTQKEKSREDFFIRRFKKVKDHFKLSSEYGVYSFRHTAALSLYYQYTKQGLSEHQAVLKIQAIMRHDNEQTTRKYLREIGGQLPEDWSKNYDYEML
ncbi:site-specific integrase [uncultured Tenacibaculum sp.]|uniref:tyrosine-type recombinase/integrase n=1 Tax=uncultured Tenacibaculum sp. TaxID=174713 RepID=UPI00261BF080|nr:site-specific integrase [uncultured Tenacibaculum sp.]